MNNTHQTSSEISYNTIRRILKQYCKEDITKEGIHYIKDYINDIIVKIGKSISIEHYQYNEIRKFHGLNTLKRIDKIVFKNLSDKLFNQLDNKKIGRLGQYNRDTSPSKADFEVV